jgi:hypothetical protein
MNKTSRVTISALLILVLLLVGCNTPSEPTTTSPTITTPIYPTDYTPPLDMNWISPGKVMVSNFYPGARAEYDINVHNGNDVATRFQVICRVPDHTGEGYVKATTEMVQDWVIIADMTPLLAPRETRDILVILTMPASAEAPAKKWEMWISVIDMSQTEFVRTELCLRWLVTMRD